MEQKLRRGSREFPNEAGLEEEVKEFETFCLILNGSIPACHWLRGHKGVPEFEISSILPELRQCTYIPKKTPGRTAAHATQ